MHKFIGLMLVFVLSSVVSAVVPAVVLAEVQAENPIVEVHSSAGLIVLELDQENAPVTVANFLAYVEKDAYAGTIFHRVIPGFMIQSGGHFDDLSELETGEPILNEADNGLQNKPGTIAMARMDEIDSAMRQWFINVANNKRLDHSPRSCTREDEQKVAAALARGLYKPQTCQSFGYAVFGRVIDGMDVVRKIERAPTQAQGMHQNVPIEPIIIDKIEVRAAAET